MYGNHLWVLSVNVLRTFLSNCSSSSHQKASFRRHVFFFFLKPWSVVLCHFVPRRVYFGSSWHLSGLKPRLQISRLLFYSCKVSWLLFGIQMLVRDCRRFHVKRIIGLSAQLPATTIVLNSFLSHHHLTKYAAVSSNRRRFCHVGLHRSRGWPAGPATWRVTLGPPTAGLNNTRFLLHLFVVSSFSTLTFEFK